MLLRTIQLKSSVTNKIELFKKCMKTRRLEDHNNYKETSKETEKIVMLAKDETWKKIGELGSSYITQTKMIKDLNLPLM